jgi:hypothetical protein
MFHILLYNYKKYILDLRVKKERKELLLKA